MSLRLRLAVGIALLLFVVLGAAAWLAYQGKKDDLERAYEQEIFTACQSLAAPVGDFVRGRVDDAGLKQGLDIVLAGEYFRRKWLKVAFLKQQDAVRQRLTMGRTLPLNAQMRQERCWYLWQNPHAWAAQVWVSARYHQEYREWTASEMDGGQMIEKTYATAFESWDGVRQFVVKVLDTRSKPFGEVRIFVSDQSLQVPLARARRLYLWLALITVIIVGALTYFLASGIAAPMERMAAALGSLTQGRFGTQLPVSGAREMRSMASSYNTLDGVLAEKARLDQDLLAAREIQMGLLPKEKLDIEGWEVWGLCLPAREVGGDFYFWHTRKDRVYAGVGDISGKGMRASLLAALSMGSLKTVFRGEEALEESFPTLNDILYHEFKGRGFLCMNAVDLAGGSGGIELVNAGQSYPILIKDYKKLEYWALENGDLPLGAVREVHYRKDPLQLSEGQGLILYSDGGPELKDTQEQLLGFEGFLGILQETMDHDLEAWGRKVLEALTAWRGEAPQHDDITLLFLRYVRKKWKTTRII